MNFPVCCFCAGPVLELPGQFGRLVPALLLPDDGDLRQAGALGAAHVVCVRESPWSVRWFTRRVEHTRHSRRLPTVGQDADFAMFRNDRMSETVIHRASGISLSVRDSQLAHAVPGGDGVDVPHTAEYNMDLDPQAALAASIRQSLLQDGQFDLGVLAEALGIASRLDIDVLADGALVYDPTLAAFWQEHWVSARVQHAVRLTDAEFALASTVRGGTGPAA